MLLATPRTSDANGGGQHGDGGLDLRTQIAALANPDSLRLEGRHDRGRTPVESPHASTWVDFGGAVNPLPTPTANQPGGSADQHLARKQRMPDGATRTTVTDLRMALQLLPTPTVGDSKTAAQSTAANPRCSYDNLTDVAAKETFGRYAAAIERWATILCRPAPAPLVDDKLNPQFVEWMMGLPPGWVTGCGISRAKQLHVLGNGVVPQQAAHAIGQLFARHDDARPMEQAA